MHSGLGSCACRPHIRSWRESKLTAGRKECNKRHLHAVYHIHASEQRALRVAGWELSLVALHCVHLPVELLQLLSAAQR